MGAVGVGSAAANLLLWQAAEGVYVVSPVGEPPNVADLRTVQLAPPQVTALQFEPISIHLSFAPAKEYDLTSPASPPEYLL